MPSKLQEFLKDGIGFCHYCRRRIQQAEASLDHKTPKHRGGHGGKRNLVVSCTFCNGLKGSADYDQFLAWCDWQLRNAVGPIYDIAIGVSAADLRAIMKYREGFQTTYKDLLLAPIGSPIHSIQVWRNPKKQIKGWASNFSASGNLHPCPKERVNFSGPYFVKGEGWFRNKLDGTGKVVGRIGPYQSAR